MGAVVASSQKVKGGRGQAKGERGERENERWGVGR